MYKLTNKIANQTYNVILVSDKNGEYRTSFPSVDGNADYERYKIWLAAGNTPEPADVPVIVESKFKGQKPKDLTPDERNEILFGLLLDKNGNIK